MSFKITGVDNLEKTLNKMGDPKVIASKILMKGIEVKCPKCHTSYTAHAKTTNCPQCNQSITIDFA